MSIRLLKGIGPARAASLERLGVRTIADALLLMPRRYEDRRSFTPIGRLRPGEAASVLGRVKAAAAGRTRRGIPYCEVLLDDRSGTLVARWYRQPYLTQMFRPGLQVILTGKLNPYPPRQMVNPEHEVQERDEAQIHVGRIVPVYPLTAGLAQRFLRRILFELARTASAKLADPFPESVRSRHRLLPLPDGITVCTDPFPKVWVPSTNALPLSCSAPDTISAALAVPSFTKAMIGHIGSSPSSFATDFVSIFLVLPLVVTMTPDFRKTSVTATA